MDILHVIIVPALVTAVLAVSSSDATDSNWRTTKRDGASSVPPPFVGRWVGPTQQGLPASRLPQNPLLGNGHLGVLLDSRVVSPQSGRTDFALRNDTRCSSENGWPLLGHNLSLRQCQANCTASARCGAFSYCDAAAGATGCANPTARITSRCFQLPDMSQCSRSPSEVGWISGLRQADPLPSTPGETSNVTLDLWLGSNSMWAVDACPGPSVKHAHNTNRSAPFNPRWAPPFAPACARRIALGGLSFELPARGRVTLTMEQHIGQPRLQAAILSELGNFTLVAYLHPVQNILVVNISSSNAVVVTVSTWALNSTASPSRATIHGSVGTVTREAVSDLVSSAHRPTLGKQIVASLASASTAIDNWVSASTRDRFAHGRYYPGHTAVTSTVALTPSEGVSVFTVVVDNSLSGPSTNATAAVTELAAARVAAAVETGTAAFAVKNAVDAWWLEFWQQSSIRLPTRPAIERFWFGAQYIMGSMASTNPAVPASGLYGPWVTSDAPEWNGDYTLDYNQEAQFYGVYGSNHPAQAASYFTPITDWLPNARVEATAFAAHLNLTRSSCMQALHFSCHLAPWGFQSVDTTIYTHWNGAFAAMLFLNNWEYTRNTSFAKQYTYPLVSGLVSWWSCFLQRSTNANGSLLLNDWNPIDPDESAENQPVHNPMTGLTFAKRLASFQITLSQALFPGQPAPRAALEIVQHLAPFPLAPDTLSSKPVWSSWWNHTSGCCTPLYPLFPTELLSQASDEDTLETARRSVRQYTGPTTTDLATKGLPVEAFPAAVRAGRSVRSGWQPSEVLEGLEKMLVLLKCCDSQMLPVASGGGVENVGVTRAVNEMLLVAPDGNYIEVFPFFPADEPASFTTLRSKGGWLVSASQSASGRVSDVQIEATVDGTCRFVDPWTATNSSGSDHSEPTVTCTPSPAAPPVTRTSVGRQHGLLTWRMTAGQRCNVTAK